MDFDELADASRLRRIAAVSSVLFFIFFMVEVYCHINPRLFGFASGLPLGDDFANYYNGARMSTAGASRDVYNIDKFMNLEHGLGYFRQFRWYSYPPIALLISMPFALIPYVASYVVWTVFLPIVMVRLLSRYISAVDAALCVLAFPPTFFNAVAGQNGDISAILLILGAMLVRDRPIVSGLAFGMLSYKPHLGVLVPIALAAGGYWKTFLSASSTVMVLIALTVALFGVDTWIGFLRNAPLNATILQSGSLPLVPGEAPHADMNFWHRTPTVFAAARLLGATVHFAYATQGVVAILVVIGLVLVWRSEIKLEIKAAALLLGAMCVTPYLWDYDLVIAIAPIVWIWRDGNGCGHWGKAVISMFVVCTLLAAPVALNTHIQMTPIFLIGMFVVCVRRAARVALEKGNTPQFAPG